MADIIAFPARPNGDESNDSKDGVIGSRFGLTVRIVSYDLLPDDLFVVLDGTSAGRTTIAALPADRATLASVIAHAALTTIEAAQATWISAKALSTA